MSSITIFINESAGLRKQAFAAADLRSLVCELQVDAEVVTAGSPPELTAKIRELVARGAGRIGVAGGDGTIHEAVQVLAGTGVALGVVPVGTRNNFAHALGLPLDPANALRVLEQGNVIQADLGTALGHYFTEAAGVGVFADILDLYGRANKNFWRGSYAILKTFWNLRSRRLRLTMDDQVVSERAVMCTIANAYRIGAGASLAPGASVVDGKLDVVILGDLTRSELIRYYLAVRRSRHSTLPKVSHMQVRSARIDATTGMAVHIDDRVVGRTPVEIKIAPASLAVLVK